MSDEYNDDDDRPDLPWPAVPPPYPEPPGRSRTSKIILLTLTAAVAAAAGFLVVTAIRDVSATPATANATPSATPSSPAQGGLPTSGSGNGSGGALPIPSTGPGQVPHLEIGGRVSAVSPTSITLGAQGQSVTAAVTKSTTITGKVHAISGIKAGDLVSAQIVSTDGKLTATAIQDPASIP